MSRRRYFSKKLKNASQHVKKIRFHTLNAMKAPLFQANSSLKEFFWEKLNFAHSNFSENDTDEE